MRYLDFFAGIGGFHSAFSRVGWECLGFCEIDKFARQSYKAIHNTEGIEEWHDITRVSDDDFRRLRGQVDIIAGGFPCQAFSVAGKRGGFEDTRGTLFFEVARAAQQIQPRYLLLENVKGLLNHDKGNTFGTILNTLHELGYAHIEWGVFNTKYWGVPQNRERVFILAELTDTPKEPYLLPLLHRQQENGVTARLRDVLETDVDEKYYLSDEKTAKLVETLAINENKSGFIGVGHHPFSKKYEFKGYVDDASPCLIATDYKAPKTLLEKAEVRATLTPDRPDKRQNGRRFKDNDEPMFTLTAQDKHGIATNEASSYRIRKLTPLECWRLQDFTNEQFYKARSVGVSDSQLYKQAGNSVTVKVVEVIARQIQKRIEGDVDED